MACILSTLFDFVYLVALLVMLWRIQMWSQRNAQSNQTIARTLSETSQKNAQSAQVAAQAAQDAVILIREQIHGSNTQQS